MVLTKNVITLKRGDTVRIGFIDNDSDNGVFTVYCNNFDEYEIAMEVKTDKFDEYFQGNALEISNKFQDCKVKNDITIELRIVTNREEIDKLCGCDTTTSVLYYGELDGAKMFVEGC